MELVHVSESHGGIEQRRKAYTAVLDEYPLCWVYWKRLAEVELQDGSVTRAFEVLGSGLAKFPNSIDLWICYLEVLQSQQNDHKQVGIVFERAAADIGNDWDSAEFWDRYLMFEHSHGTPASLMKVYKRVLAVPMPVDKHQRYWFAVQTILSDATFPLIDYLLDNTERAAFITWKAVERQTGPAAGNKITRSILNLTMLKLFQKCLSLNHCIAR